MENAFQLIVEQPNYDVKYLIEEKNRNTPSTMHIQGPFLMADLANRNNRIYPLEEMVKEVDRYNTEMIKNNRATGELEHPNCHLETAKILTGDGWKFLKDIDNEEMVYSLNPDTREIELHQIDKKIDDAYTGKLYHIKGRNIDTKVTPNHRFLVYDRYNKPSFVTAEELYNNRNKYNHSTIPKQGNWVSETPELFKLEGLKNIKDVGRYNINPETDSYIKYETFVKFLGIWLSEGWTVKSEKTIVGITQKKSDIVIKIREMLSEFPDEMKWSETITDSGTSIFKLLDYRLAEYLKNNFGTTCYNKKIAKEFKNLDSTLLDELVYWFNLGDGRFGNCDGYDFRNVFSTSEQLILDLNEILFKSGGCGNIREIEAESDYYFAGRLIKAENKSILYQLNISSTNNIHLDSRFLKITPVDDFSGRVYCVTVKHGNFYCMDNGKSFWTGNSATVNLERVCHVVTELKQDGNIFLGKSKILSTPMGNIVKSLIMDGVKLGVSSRALGRLDEKGGKSMVSEIHLVAVDVVADPSVPTAFVNGILESKKWLVGESGLFEPVYADFEKSISKLPKKAQQEFLKEQVINFINAIKKL